MPEEREQLVPVLQQPRPQGLGGLGPERPGRQDVEELGPRPARASPGAAASGRAGRWSCDDRPQERPERAGDRLEFRVERVVQQLLVHVPHQVDQALLLRAREGVVGRVEVRHQHAAEVLEQLGQEVPLPGRPVQVHDLLGGREHPDVPLPGPQLHLGLVDVQDRAGEDLLEQPLVARPVVPGHQRLEPVDLLLAHRKPEELLEHLFSIAD